MVSEAINRLGGRRLLSEITAVDAYTRFYKGKISPEVYQMLMSGTTNMTPFHKIALDFLTNKETENKYFTEEGDFAKTIGDLWCKLTPEGRQFLIKSCEGDPSSSKNFESFSYLVRIAAKMKMFSEKQYRNSGLEVLYKKGNLSVTCTKSYSSSCHFYGKSHWCTASDMFGRYDGHQMFKEYTIECWNGRGILVQFYNGGENSYQVQYLVESNGDLKVGQCCNWEDSTANIDNIDNMLAGYGVTYEEIFTNYIRPNSLRLVEETEELTMDEDNYYNIKRTERLNKIFGGIDRNTTSKQADDFARTAAMESQATRFEDPDGLYTCWVARRPEVNGRIFVTLKYNGANEAERGMMEQYADDMDESFFERYGRVPNNFMSYAFNEDGTLINKWRGEISCDMRKLTFITEGYGEELIGVNVVAIINTDTYETIVDKPFNFCYLDDVEWVVDKYINEFIEGYNEEFRENIDESDINRSEWYICQPTREDNRANRYLAINCETLKEFYFQT